MRTQTLTSHNSTNNKRHQTQTPHRYNKHPHPQSPTQTIQSSREKGETQIQTTTMKNHAKEKKTLSVEQAPGGQDGMKVPGRPQKAFAMQHCGVPQPTRLPLGN